MNTARAILTFTPVLLLLWLSLLQPHQGIAGIDESIRITPEVLRVLDSIAPNTTLVYLEKRGRTFGFIGSDFNMSVHGIDESYNWLWSWTPTSPGMSLAELFNVKLSEDGMGGECLVVDREVPFVAYPHSFQYGRTTDTAAVTLPKPLYEKVLSIDSHNGLLAVITGFLTRVENRFTDSMYAYVIDTSNARHLKWPLPVAENILEVQQIAIRIVDTIVCMYWLEHVGGNAYRTRIATYDVTTGRLLHVFDVSNLESPRYQLQKILVDESTRTVHIISRATARNKPAFGLQYWKIDLEKGTVDSTEDYLPTYTYLNVHDAILTEDKRVVGVGSIWDINQPSMQIIEPSARGCMFEYAPDGTLKRFVSMQDQRPTRLTSVFYHQQDMLVCGNNESGTPFIGRVDESRITSIPTEDRIQHTPMQHIAWYSVTGEYLQHPTDGAVIEVFQCSQGCCHAALNCYMNAEKIGSGTDHHSPFTKPVSALSQGSRRR